MNIIESFASRDIDDETMRTLSDLGLPGKMMHSALIRARYPRRRRKNSRVFIAKWCGEIIAWGLADVKRFSDAHRMYADVGVYVAPCVRKHGLGKMIIEEELKWIKENTRAEVIHAHPHDEKSAKLFARCGIFPASFHVTYKAKVERG